MTELASDKKDREVLQSKIEICIHPLKPESNPEQLVNMANRTIGHSQLLDLPAGYGMLLKGKLRP